MLQTRVSGYRAKHTFAFNFHETTENQHTTKNRQKQFSDVQFFHGFLTGKKARQRARGYTAYLRWKAGRCKHPSIDALIKYRAEMRNQV